MSFKKATRGWGGYSTYFYSDDLNLWVWKDGSTYYMSANVGIPVSIDGSGAYKPSGYLYNGKDYRVCGSLYLWYESGTYYLSSYLGFGNISTLEYWTSSSLTGTYTMQGTATADKTVAAVAVTGRSNDELYGIYEPVDGSGLTGDMYLGYITKYKIENYEGEDRYVKTSNKYNGKYIYLYSNPDAYFLYLWYNGERWIISNIAGSYAGKPPYLPYFYYEQHNPLDIATGTYDTRSGNEFPAPITSSENIEVVIDEYGEGTEPEEIYMAQVAVWL